MSPSRFTPTLRSPDSPRRRMVRISCADCACLLAPTFRRHTTVIDHLNLHVLAGTGWFDVPYIRSMLDAEFPGRMRDIQGPESDALVNDAGWAFTEDPLHAALVNQESTTLAVAWITATTRGLNLTYAVAHSAEGRGLATLASAHSILAYNEQRHSLVLRPGLTVHAQYDGSNHPSACVANHLGLVSTASLSFAATHHGERRVFFGSEAPWDSVLLRAKEIVSRGVV